MSVEELAIEFDKEFEDLDIKALKALAISEGANANEVNSCTNKPCVIAIIASLRISKHIEQLNLEKKNKRRKLR